MRRAAGVAVLLAALAGAAPAAAQDDYGTGAGHGAGTRPAPRSARVLHAGPGTLRGAIARARAGDTVRLAPGAYRAGVLVRGRSRRGLRLVGTPGRVVLHGGLRVEGVAGVVLSGLEVRGAPGTGIDLAGADGVVLRRVVAARNGGDGVRIARTRGASATGVLAYGNAGAGVAVVRSPAALRATRTFLREVTAWGNRIGVVVDRAGPVTVARARLVGNATGMVTAAATGVVLRDSDVLANDLTGAPAGVLPALPGGAVVALGGPAPETGLLRTSGPPPAGFGPPGGWPAPDAAGPTSLSSSRG